MASADRIPAPISPAAAGRLVSAAKKAHQALGFFGVVRYDFFLKDEDGEPQVILNEANTVPGSFAFYLFDPAASRSTSWPTPCSTSRWRRPPSGAPPRARSSRS